MHVPNISTHSLLGKAHCEEKKRVNTTELQQVEDDDGAGDKQSLARLNAIDAGKYVDGICAEYSKHAHINIVENTCRI